MAIARVFFLAVRAGTAFWNLFEGINFQKSKNKIINKSFVSKFQEFSKLAHYLQPSR
jgi:GMP synthase PP-ATPase subunit